MKTFIRIHLLTALVLGGLLPSHAQPKWPNITRQTKPWTRWWWMGSAVNDKDLTRLMEQYHRAGLGALK